MQLRNVLVIGVLVLLAGAGRAQQVPVEKPLPPGYEALVAAGKTLQTNEKLTAAMAEKATLTQKRDALAQKEVGLALEKLRDWLAGPQRPANLSTQTEVPIEVLGQMRQITRTLSMEQYVLLSEGKTREAIASARDGLRLSYVIKETNFLGWMTGLAMDRVSVATMTRHLDQLSIYDCDRLSSLATDWMRSSDTVPLMLLGEKLRMLKLMTEHRAAIRQAFAAGTPPNGQEVPKEIQKLDRAGLENALNEAAARVGQEFGLLVESLSQPYPDTPPAIPVKTTSPTAAELIAAEYIHAVAPLTNKVRDASLTQQTQAQLLACHAAIHRFRWEHGELPAALTALQLGKTIVDPYSGRPFRYELTGTNYLLESVGPFARDDEGNPLPGKRLPVKMLTDR